MAMQAQWRQEALLVLGHDNESVDASQQGQQSPGLLHPPSRCPSCGHSIRWFENIPLLSYVVLKGRCSACGCRISPRYPAVELICSALWAGIAFVAGLSWVGLAFCLFASVLVALFFIDLDTQLLPDQLTIPLIWAGLLFNAAFGLVPLEQSLYGAVLGYLSLWGFYHLFRLATGKEGMGYGDFKLLAALGAWFGVTSLLPIIVASSVAGALLGGALMATGSLRPGQPFPFGPFLVLPGLLAIFIEPDRWLRVLGV